MYGLYAQLDNSVTVTVKRECNGRSKREAKQAF